MIRKKDDDKKRGRRKKGRARNERRRNAHAGESIDSESFFFFVFFLTTIFATFAKRREKFCSNSPVALRNLKNHGFFKISEHRGFAAEIFASRFAEGLT